MPARPVTLPTPEQERKAILAVLAFGLLAGIGFLSLLVAGGLVVERIARWVFA